MPSGGGSFPASLPPSGSAGGDLGGSYPNPTVDLATSGGTLGGDVVVQPASGDVIFGVHLAGDATTGLEAGVADSGGGLFSASLRVRGKGTGEGFIAVDQQTVNGESATISSYGGLSLFTETGRKGIEAWDDQGNVLRFALLVAGQPMIGVTAAPADGDLAASQVALWFDDTNGVGNTKLMVKGKSADGTVKTATILLA